MIAILTRVHGRGAASSCSIPPGQWDSGGFRAVPFLTQLFAAASYQLSWSIYVSDYSRYLPREVGVRASFWWTYLGAFIGGAWMMLVGHGGRRHRAEARRRRGGRARRRPGLPRVRASAADRRPARTGHHHGAQFLRRLAHAPERRRHGAAAALKSTIGKRVASLALAFAASTAIALALLEQTSSAASMTCSPCCCTCSRPGPRSTSSTSTWSARATTRSARSSIPRGMYGRWNWRGLIAYAVGFCR